MAPCATARLAGVVAVVLSPLASVITVFAASEDIAEGVVCASLCVEASERERYTTTLDLTFSPVLAVSKQGFKYLFKPIC
jgi:hypothetical protein